MGRKKHGVAGEAQLSFRLPEAMKNAFVGKVKGSGRDITQVLKVFIDGFNQAEDFDPRETGPKELAIQCRVPETSPDRCDILIALPLLRDAHPEAARTLEELHTKLLRMGEILVQELTSDDQAHESTPIPGEDAELEKHLRRAASLTEASRSNRRSAERALKNAAAAKRNEGGAKRA